MPDSELVTNLGDRTLSLIELEDLIGTAAENTPTKDTNISSVLGDGLKTFKTEIEEKISGLSNLINRSDSLASEFHKKTDKVVQEIEGIKNVTNKASNDSSKEVLALLKLSEYQSGIRMNAESKYGDMKDIEKMTADTIDIIYLFDKLQNSIFPDFYIIRTIIIITITCILITNIII